MITAKIVTVELLVVGRDDDDLTEFTEGECQILVDACLGSLPAVQCYKVIGAEDYTGGHYAVDEFIRLVSEWDRKEAEVTTDEVITDRP